MQGDPIPPEHHVLRYASPSRLEKNDNDRPVRLLHTALRLRPEVETYLSVQWAEYFSSDLLTQCYAAIRAHSSDHFTPARNGAYGVAKVADILTVAAAHRPPARLRIAHEPEENNPAHAGVHELPAEDIELLEALAFDAFTMLIPVNEVPGL